MTALEIFLAHFWSALESESVILPTFDLESVGFRDDKKAPTASFRLPCLEIRSRNEEAINSKRNMIYSLKVFYFLLHRRRYFLFISELIWYAC